MLKLEREGERGREGGRAGEVFRSAGREQKLWDCSVVSDGVLVSLCHCGRVRGLGSFLWGHTVLKRVLHKRWVAASNIHTHTLSHRCELAQMNAQMLSHIHVCTNNINFLLRLIPLLIQTDVFRGTNSCMTSEVTCSYYCTRCHFKFQRVFEWYSAQWSLCVCRFLMGSPGSQSCLFCIVVFVVPWTAASHSMCEAKRGPSNVCVAVSN